MFEPGTRTKLLAATLEPRSVHTEMVGGLAFREPLFHQLDDLL